MSADNLVYSDGKRVTVVDFECRGGVHVKLGDKAFTVSPFALLGNSLERSGGKKAKAARPAPKDSPGTVPVTDSPRTSRRAGSARKSSGSSRDDIGPRMPCEWH